MLVQYCNHSKQCRNNAVMPCALNIAVAKRPVSHHLNVIDVFEPRKSTGSGLIAFLGDSFT